MEEKDISKTMRENAMMVELYRRGFIRDIEKGFHVDARNSELQKSFGKSSDQARTILVRIVDGLMKGGYKIKFEERVEDLAQAMAFVKSLDKETLPYVVDGTYGEEQIEKAYKYFAHTRLFEAFDCEIILTKEK